MSASSKNDEFVLAIKEQLRQFDRIRNRLPRGVLNRRFEPTELHEVFEHIRKALGGQISQEEFEFIIGRLSEQEAAIGPKLDRLTESAMLSAKNTAREKNLGPAAPLLASDAFRRCGDGLSKEEWISEVLVGHSADDAAQLGCLTLILTLWLDGPWPWARD